MRTATATAPLDLSQPLWTLHKGAETRTLKNSTESKRTQIWMTQPFPKSWLGPQCFNIVWRGKPRHQRAKSPLNNNGGLHQPDTIRNPSSFLPGPAPGWPSLLFINLDDCVWTCKPQQTSTQCFLNENSVRVCAVWIKRGNWIGTGTFEGSGKRKKKQYASVLKTV